MRYRVRLTERAARDLEEIQGFVGADSSAAASAWFADLAAAVYSLERFPERGEIAAEKKTVRQSLFGAKPNTYRIIYEVDKRNGLVNVVHLRHAARAPFSTLNDV